MEGVCSKVSRICSLGPWKCRRRRKFKWFNYSAVYEVLDKDDNTIAKVTGVNRDHDCALMASAPEMRDLLALAKPVLESTDTKLAKNLAESIEILFKKTESNRRMILLTEGAD